ncbi:hypothetical protein [Ureaplasma diversum]|nr:hypothetical protein [Ureaplasma diversum]
MSNLLTPNDLGVCLLVELPITSASSISTNLCLDLLFFCSLFKITFWLLALVKTLKAKGIAVVTTNDVKTIVF